jgi:hypothetical protein
VVIRDYGIENMIATLVNVSAIRGDDINNKKLDNALSAYILLI